jgi:uncharacterized membrane protein YciS (DUF1049 family)
VTAGWTLFLLAVAFVCGWFCCSYFEAQARIEARRNGRIIRSAEREGRSAQ